MIFILTSLIGLSFSILWPFFFYLGSTYNKKGRNTLINVILLASSAGTCMAPYLVKIVSKVNMNLSVAMVSFIFILIIIFLLILMNIKKKNPVLNDLF
jgi:fucose permease